MLDVRRTTTTRTASPSTSSSTRTATSRSRTSPSGPTRSRAASSFPTRRSRRPDSRTSDQRGRSGSHPGRPSWLVSERARWTSHNLFEHLGEHTVNGLTKGSIYALVALGYTLVYGVLRLINFAHSEVFMVGTWTVLGVYTVLGRHRRLERRHDRSGHVLALSRRRGRLGRHGAGRRTDRLPTAAQEERAALIFLITAIGCSLVLVEIFGLVLRLLLRPAVRPGPDRLPSLVDTDVLFSIGDTEITNIRLLS